ncbi:MAG: thymidine kinase [Candidatus Bipolaricaulota bacterium]
MPARLEVITGCMFSGKTEELLRRVERAHIAKKSVLLFKPSLDTRYCPEEVVAHHGRSLPCFRVPPNPMLEDLRSAAGWEADTADVIAFDEGNFFGPDFPALCDELVQAGKRVIVAGLDQNFRAQPFGPMPVLLALADEVLKLSAVCMCCGQPATRTQRLVDGQPATGGPEVLVGGQESYEARCRSCFVPPSEYLTAGPPAR